MDFKQNYFEIFQLPAEFQIDTELLSERYRTLQRTMHPDKFANAPDRDRRMAMQWATQINEGYTTLRRALPRAIYLMKLNGVDMSTRQNAPVDPEFLMEQISLREDLEEIEVGSDALEKIDDFKARVGSVMAGLEEEFAAQINVDIEGAEQTVLKMQFMHKLIGAADQLEEKLLD